MTLYLKILNIDKLYLLTRQESNLLILGTLSDNILHLKDKELI